jgi:hypothetical protein
MHKIKKDGMTFLVSDNKAILEKFTDYNSESLTIPSKIIVNEQTYTVDEIMENVFNNQNLILKYVSIPYSISKIGDRAFYNLKTLERVEIEKDSKLCEIGNFAFSALENLEEFNIPESVNTIGNCTFRNTVGISEIHISKNLTQIGSSAFVGMTNLEKIYCDSENPIYSSLNGVLFSKKKFKLIFYPPSKEDLIYSVPRGTTTIEFSSFRDSVNIEVINMPNSVKKICSNAFKFSSKLIKLVFEPGNEIPGINNFFFNDANILIEIESKSETELRKTGYFIINNVKSIYKIIFPKYIEFIHDFMFCNAINLKEVEFEQGSELKEIGSNAFENAKSLTRIKLPRKLEKISDYAFCGNLSLKEVEFEEGSELKEIGSNAFENAESLSRIKIPKSIEVIADNAFYGTSNLHKIDLEKGSSLEQRIKELKIKYDMVPDWLMSVVKDEEKFQQNFSLKKLLGDSLYYPCCGVDTKPINLCNGHIFSYIYVDLTMNPEDHDSWIKSNMNSDFNSIEDSYSLVKIKKIKPKDLIPYDWSPELRPNKSEGFTNELYNLKRGAPKWYAYWSLWKRNDLKSLLGYKPKYFSLLYLGGYEMNYVYQGLYNRLNVRPKAMSIINPGMGFWDYKRIDDKVLYYSFFEKVLKINNLGFPPYLIGNLSYTIFYKYYETLKESELINRLKE